MKEEFLKFIWERQYFDKYDLKTEQGQTLTVIAAGSLNSHAGPDFHEARIILDHQLWIGEIEIHVKSSEWYLHNHHKDTAYDQVVLHVVWSDNRKVENGVGQEIPTLVLKSRVSTELVLRHRHLFNSSMEVPCESLSTAVCTSQKLKMLGRTIEERLLCRATEVLDILQSNGHDWDQLTYMIYGKSFGFSLNSPGFDLLVRRVPLSIVRKIRSNLFQLEALYFGQAGFLRAVNGDAYYLKLQLEYQYLKDKYILPSGLVKKSVWKYLRLRPANFPSLRIAQFASFMHHRGYRFSHIRESKNSKSYRMVEIVPSLYWHSHYDFGKVGGKGHKLGRSSKERLAINAAVPILAAYSIYTGQPEYRSRAIEFLKNLPAEQNHILSYWKGIGFEVSSAQDSQALLELYHKYCKMKRCLDCEIGKSLMTFNSTA